MVLKCKCFLMFSNQVIVTLEGVTPETGCSVQVIPLDTKNTAKQLDRRKLNFQARTSYLPSEILWGQRLVKSNTGTFIVRATISQI